MKIKELIEKLEEIAERRPDVVVRIETYNKNSYYPSKVNGISKVLEHPTLDRITILGDGIIEDY